MNVFREKRWARWRPSTVAAWLLAYAVMTPASAAEHETLSIGITQFPATLNPNIDVMAAKSYVLGMALRPFTVYGADWSLICLLCAQLPSIANGLAVPVDLPDGKKGIDLTYTIRPDAQWADGVPVTTADVTFTYEVGRNPQSGISNAELYRRISGIDIKDDKTFTLHVDKMTFDYAAIHDFMLMPAHIERDAFAAPAEYRLRTRYNTDPTNPGLLQWPYRVTNLSRLAHSGAECALGGSAGPISADHGSHDREYRGARSHCCRARRRDAGEPVAAR
jgi:peptide/nickel transport system substrate-binding protein